jgi:hypothetical protein
LLSIAALASERPRVRTGPACQCCRNDDVIPRRLVGKEALDRCLVAGVEHSLDLTQEQAGELFGASVRTGQRWAAEGKPLPVAIVLLLVGNDRAKLDRVADKLAIKRRARWSNLMRGYLRTSSASKPDKDSDKRQRAAATRSAYFSGRDNSLARGTGLEDV